MFLERDLGHRLLRRQRKVIPHSSFRKGAKYLLSECPESQLHTTIDNPKIK